MDTLPSYVIQTANLRDLISLGTLEKECFKEDAWPLLDLIGVLTFPGVIRLRAVVNEGLVGFIAGDPRRTEKIGWILTLGVLSSWRRQGIGYNLLSTCEQKMGMPTVKLTVRRNNLEAFHLYEKMGYQQVDIWSHYYRNGEDGLVLEKHL